MIFKMSWQTEGNVDLNFAKYLHMIFREFIYLNTKGMWREELYYNKRAVFFFVYVGNFFFFLNLHLMNKLCTGDSEGNSIHEFTGVL